jgi:hypothetical protein
MLNSRDYSKLQEKWYERKPKPLGLGNVPSVTVLVNSITQEIYIDLEVMSPADTSQIKDIALKENGF